MLPVSYFRSSSATYVNSNGLLARALYTSPPTQYTRTVAAPAGVNLFTYSEDFTNAAWAKSGLTVAASGVTPPTGFSSAQRITEASGAISLSALSQGGNSTVFQTLSIYAKEDPLSAKRYLVVGIFYGVATTRWAWTVVDLAAQEFRIFVDGVQDVAFGTVITPLNDGWYRVAVTVQSPLAGQPPAIGMTNTFNPPNSQNLGGYTGDGTSGMFITGAQIENVPESSIVAEPRFDWANQTPVPLKNLLTYTENFGSPSWNPNAGVLSLAAGVAPDGSNAYSWVSNNGVAVGGGNSNTGMLNCPFVTSTGFVLSVYAKSNGNRYFAFGTGAFGARAWFDLQNGVTAGNSWNPGGWPVSPTSAIESIGSGWYRCSVYFPGSMVTTVGFFSGNVVGAVTGDGVNGVYVWRPQAELGSTPTVYEPVAQPTTVFSVQATAASSGILLEESRANRILWCRDATQANWTKTNVTVARDQTGIDGIANTATRITATAGGGTCTQTITLASGSRTSSVYLRRVTGSGPVQVSMDGTTWSTIDLSSMQWRRSSLSGTVTNPVVAIRLLTNGDAVAMDYAQVEDAEGASSPIFTTSAAATRAGDVAWTTANNDGSITNITRFSAYAQFDYCFRNGSSTGPTTLNLCASNNDLFINIFNTDGRSNVGFISPSANSLIPQIGVTYKVSGSYMLSNSALGVPTVNGAINGVSYPFGTSYLQAAGFALSTSSVLRIGIGNIARSLSSGAGGQNGRISRIVLWQSQMSRDALIGITS
jgi:hypothetical protein